MVLNLTPNWNLIFIKKCKALGLDIKYQPCVFEYTDSFNRKHYTTQILKLMESYMN